MYITLSPEDYAVAFRILSANDRHPLNLAELVENRVAPCLPRCHRCSTSARGQARWP